LAVYITTLAQPLAERVEVLVSRRGLGADERDACPGHRLQQLDGDRA
jgi:hypothetical protein